MTEILWFRRDLRLTDHPALTAAAELGAVLPVYLYDAASQLTERPLTPAGPRRLRLEASVRALSVATGGALVVGSGDPTDVLADLAVQLRAERVHVTAACTPDGRRRDAAVARRLAERGIALVRSGTAYAVPPGTLRTGAGTPYQVFTPFARAWRDHGAPPPLPAPRVRWAVRPAAEVTEPPALEAEKPGRAVSAEARSSDTTTGAAPSATPRAEQAGEAAAQSRWHAFLDQRLSVYADERDRPDRDGTSRMSAHLALGEVHPRTLLADLAPHAVAASQGARRFVDELGWREFCADVLWHHPEASWTDLRSELAGLDRDQPGPEIEAWRAGRTGFPLVDAGMRQLLAEGWLHNRVRMVAASFLVKDLHVRWQVGARHFLQHLVDGDLASNNLNWQWVAGTGSDAAPYVRVFNPVRQGLRFDPDGDYVRRWVPELAHLPGRSAQEPWRHPGGYDHGYPQRILDHEKERREELAAYRRARERV